MAIWPATPPKLIQPSLTPFQSFHVTVGIDVVAGTFVAIVANPALISVDSRSPLDQRRFAHPGIVVILADIAVVGIIRGIHGL